MFNDKDLDLLNSRNVTVDQINKQLDSFKTGFPYLKLDSAATVGNGIIKLDDKEENEYISLWNEFLAGDGCVLKFVPASGAASRMFKNLYAFLDSDSDVPDNDFIKTYFANIEKFAFYDSLNEVICKKTGKNINQHIESGNYKAVVEYLLTDKGLNYGFLPKALLYFHKVGDSVHTALEEHLEEGAQYACCHDNVNLHFTVSADHKKLVEEKIKTALPHLVEKFNVKYNITLSEQKKSTDTIAVNPDNTPFRENGNLFFRPGGHGALIENLNDIDSDVVFIKNIDNVVPSTKRDITIKYKKIIGGILVSVQKKIAEYLKMLDNGSYSESDLNKILDFTRQVLCIHNRQIGQLRKDEVVSYLKRKLNRPIRVCGVVRNEGEPGGGPYIAYNSDGTSSPQILESSQIDSSDSSALELMRSATHFNPVDLVCYVKDYKGEKFNLPDYVDQNTGFISEKSKSGHVLKALELPGLWNGAMSDWNTIFVEVPIETFNPVKTVNDLLRPAHQG